MNGKIYSAQERILVPPQYQQPDISNPGINPPQYQQPDISNPSINPPEYQQPDISNPGINPPPIEIVPPIFELPPGSTSPDVDCNTCIIDRIGLAQAIVPSQPFTAPMESEQALVCGTAFSDLVMPYCSGWNFYRNTQEV